MAPLTLLFNSNKQLTVWYNWNWCKLFTRQVLETSPGFRLPADCHLGCGLTSHGKSAVPEIRRLGKHTQNTLALWQARQARMQHRILQAAAHETSFHGKVWLNFLTKKSKPETLSRATKKYCSYWIFQEWGKSHQVYHSMNWYCGKGV